MLLLCSSFGQVVERDLIAYAPVSVLSDYIKIQSISGEEFEAGEYLSTIAKDLGLHIRHFGRENGNYNFTASIYPLELQKPNIVFLNHIDVVPAGDLTKWEHPPFSGIISNNEIWGRGTFDNKGVAIMQLMAIADFTAKAKLEDLPYNVTMLSVSCEESQCQGGAKYVADNHLGEINPIVLIGEGPPALDSIISTNPDEVIFGIATAHKRSFWLELKLLINTTSHGSVTPLEYANKEMILALERLLSKKQKAVYTKENVQLLRELGKLEKGVKQIALGAPRLFKPIVVSQLRKRPEVFSVFSNTITLTRINSVENACNVIPTEITACLDCRLLPEADEKAFLEDVQKRLDNPNIEIIIMDSAPVMQVSSTKNQFYTLLKESILEYHGDVKVIPLILPNMNDSGIFRSKGIPAFDIAPARIPNELLHNIHGYNERIPVSFLYEGIDVFRLFLEKCMTPPDKRGKKRIWNRLIRN